MKLATVGDEVVRIGLGVEREFKIKATAKAFRILSSGLYKDKIGAILRELSANAYDAHISAGKADKPFRVHLPNTMEPYLGIRDFGPGLSHDDLLNIYTTYFESTKTESNDYVGALGLGSKSPFSYVKAFTVVSRHGGMERTYDAFIDEDGMPSIALRSATVFDGNIGDTGLEVIVPVSSSRDYQEFYTKAKSTYTYYPVKPTVIGWNGFEHDSLKYVLEGPGYRLREYRYQYGYGRQHDERAVAVMGIVGYPIDREALLSASEEVVDPRRPNQSQTFWSSEHIDSILQSPIEIDFQIGSLDITAGREELSYEPITVKSLRKRLKEIVADMKSRVTADFASCKTMREARQLYAKLFKNDSPLMRALGNKITVEFQGQKIDSVDYAIDMKDFPNLTVREYSNAYRGARASEVHKYDSTRSAWANRMGVSSGSQVEFRVKDIETSFEQRIHHYRTSNQGKQVFLIECTDVEEFERFKKLMDGYDFKPVSELPKPPSAPKTRAKVKTLSSLTWMSVHSEPVPAPRYSGHWAEEEVTVEDGGYYILTRHSNFENSLKSAEDAAKEQEAFESPAEYLSEQSKRVASVLTAAHHTKLWNFSTDKLRAIPVTESKKFVESDDWTNALEVLRENATKRFANDVSLQQQIAKARAKRVFLEKVSDQSWAQTLTAVIPLLRVRDPNHSVIAVYNLHQELIGMPINLEFYETIADNLGVELTSSDIPEEYDLHQMWGQMMSDYPLFKYLMKAARYGIESPTPQEYVNYFTMVDQRTGANPV